MYIKLNIFLEDHNSISEKQWGGRKAHNPLGLISHLMFKAAEKFKGKENEIALVVLFDQSKFYDRSEANRILKKLNDLGVQGSFLFQIKEILMNRECRVRVNSKLSTKMELRNGVPQGLSLSLPSSSVYTNDLEEHLREELQKEDGKKTKKKRI